MLQINVCSNVFKRLHHNFSVPTSTNIIIKHCRYMCTAHRSNCEIHLCSYMITDGTSSIGLHALSANIAFKTQHILVNPHLHSVHAAPEGCPWAWPIGPHGRIRHTCCNGQLQNILSAHAMCEMCSGNFHVHDCLHRATCLSRAWYVWRSCSNVSCVTLLIDSLPH